MPANTAIIGRVAVKVLPDTTDFRRDTQRKLDALEKSLKIEIPTTVDMTGAKRDMIESIRKINAENRTMGSRKIRLYTTISTAGMRDAANKAVRDFNSHIKDSGQKIRLNADLVAGKAKLELDKESLKDVQRELDHWRKQHDPIKITVKPDLAGPNMIESAARLNYLARPRTVNLIPHVDSKAAAAAATALAALSGARVLSNMFENLWDSLKNLDKAVPTIGAIALGLSAVSAWGLTALSNITALVYAIGQIGPAALALPGIFGGIAIGVGITYAALKDFNTIFPDVKKNLSALQDTISRNFWAEAVAPMREMIDTLLPQLASGSALVATQIGKWFAGLANGLRGALSGELKQMFVDLSKSIDIASTATSAIANIIKNLGSVGAGYLPRLAEWFVRITKQFDAWLNKAANDGRLKQWIDTALEQLHELGQVFKFTFQTIAGLGKTAAAAGGSTLSVLADTMERLANAVNSEGFKTGLTSVLESAHLAMSTIATVSGPAVKELFSTLSETLPRILSLTGMTVGTILKTIATALADPKLQQGLTSLFIGLSGGIASLAPAVAALGPVLGVLGEVIGKFASQLGPLLAAVIDALAPAFIAVGEAVQPLIGILGHGLTEAVRALAPTIEYLAPVITEFAQQIGGSLASAVSTLAPAFAAMAQALGPALASLVQAVTPLITGLVEVLAGGLGVALTALAKTALPALTSAFTSIGPALASIVPMLGEMVTTLIKGIGPIIPLIAQAFVQLVQGLAPLAAAILPAIIGILPALSTSLIELLTAVLPVIPVFTQLLTAILVPLLPVITELVATLLPPLAQAIAALVPAVMPLITAIAQLIALIVPVLIPVLVVLVELLVGSVTDAINGVANIFKGAIDIIQGAFDIFVGLFTGDWSQFWDGIKQVFVGIWEEIKGIFAVILNVGVLGIAGKGLKLVKDLFKMSWQEIKVALELAWGVIKDGFGKFLQILAGTPGKFLGEIKQLFRQVWDDIKNIVSMAWDSVRKIFGDGIGNAVNTVRTLPSKILDALGDMSTLLVRVGEDVIRGFIRGIGNMFGAVKGKLGQLTDKLFGWKGPPAKDRVLLFDAGVLVIQGFINGLESQYDAVKKSLGGLTDDLGGMTVQTPDVMAGTGARVAGLVNAAYGSSQINKILNYYAAPGSSLSSEEDLWAASGRARMVGW